MLGGCAPLLTGRTVLTVENPIDSQDPWHDDVLERGALGKVLEDHLINRFSAGNHEPLSLALDGRWGSGKSFFVERWTKQLINNGRFVISFNAWQHDGSPEPSLALIGELRRQLQDLSQRVISQELTSDVLESKIKATVDSAKKAIKPMLKVAASGILKRVIGSSVSDFTDAISGEDEEEEQTSNDDTRILDKALDAYLDQILSDHELHQASISKFRNDLASLARAISKANAPDEKPIGPVIIIIDELDRCRPDFAVRLLEGVKHLFSVQNVCFVFATNLAQLTASIEVVYGTNFSGREYLGRFFDRELALPNISRDGFTQLLFQQPLPANVLMGAYPVDNGQDSIEKSFWLGLSDSMNLSLRQQQQAFAIFQVSCESYREETELPGVWLMFLSQLKAASPKTFTHLHEQSDGSSRSNNLRALFKDQGWSDKNLGDSRGYQGAQLQTPLLLLNLLQSFFFYSKLTSNEAANNYGNSRDPLDQQAARFTGYLTKDRNRTLLQSTFDIVAAAGMFSYR